MSNEHIDERPLVTEPPTLQWPRLHIGYGITAVAIGFVVFVLCVIATCFAVKDIWWIYSSASTLKLAGTVLLVALRSRSKKCLFTAWFFQISAFGFQVVCFVFGVLHCVGIRSGQHYASSLFGVSVAAATYSFILMLLISAYVVLLMKHILAIGDLKVPVATDASDTH